MIVVRRARPEDDAALVQIDASIETPIIYKVVGTAEGFALERTAVDPPFRKEYAMRIFRQMAPPCDHEWIAEANGRPIGFIGTAMRERHKRCTIWHLYVDKAHRRQGIGRRLMHEAGAQACNSGAELLWVETQNVNAPGIAA